MYPIPQVLNTPDDAVNEELPTLLIKIVGPELAIRFLTGEPMKGADHDRMGHAMMARFFPRRAASR